MGKMAQFEKLIRFESAGKVLFAEPAPTNSSAVPSVGSRVTAYSTIENLFNKKEPLEAVIEKV